SALAASFAAVAALQLYRPELLPVQLRVKPKVQTVEVRSPAPPLPAQLVAVLQQNAAEPAFILTVDQAAKTFTVRRVGAAPPPEKSFELWLVSDKLPRPRSLGVIGESDFTSRPALAAFDADTINQAIYAVTVEPAGGSPTGNPTTNPIYAGKLIESVPAGGQIGR
ncbi:MAG TPA: anti-sigma factor, partial [Afipia sp.]